MEMSNTPTPTSVSVHSKTVTVGGSTLIIQWDDTKSGTIECWRKVFLTHDRSEVRKLGDLDFSVLALEDFAQWDYLHERKPGLDGTVLCLLLEHVENNCRHIPGVGAACVYALALSAETQQAKHMIVSNAIASAFEFYEKMGFLRFDTRCFDFYGETATVKQKAQQSASKH